MTGASIQQQTLGSSQAAIMLGAAATISLGNVWRLPVMTGEAGGWLFFGSYLVALVLLAWPLLTAELMVGRLARRDPSGAYFWITTKGKIPGIWRWAGVPVLLVSFPVAAFVTVFLGWTLAASGLTAAGLVGDAAATESVGQLGRVTQHFGWSVGLAIPGLLTTAAVIGLTSLQAVRRASRWSLVLVFAIAAGMLLFAVYQHGASASVDTLHRTVTHIGIGRPIWMPVLEAVREAFFTVSLGVGVVIILGSLLPDGARPGSVAGGILMLDLMFTLLAGLALVLLRVGSLESELAQPISGISALFQSLPLRIGEAAGGRALLAAWYLGLAAMGWFSLLLLLMPGVAWLRRVAGLSDLISVAVVVAIVATLVVLLLFSLVGNAETLAESARHIWRAAQWLCASLIVPLNGLLLCLFVSRMMPAPLLRRAWGKKHGVGYLIWLTLMRYPARVLVILLCLFSTGIIHRLVELWSG